MSPVHSNYEGISNAEAEALARYVRDIKARMQQVTELLHSRDAAASAHLALSIQEDLATLEEQLTQRTPALHVVRAAG